MLTDAKIRSLKPREARYLVSDGRGLSLDILPSDIRSWIFRYRLNGKQERVTLGKYPDLSLADARRKRDSLAGNVDKGKSPAKEKKLERAGRSSDPTLEEFCHRYYREQVAPRLKSPGEIRRYIDNEICPFLGNRLLKEVDVLDCQRLIYRKRDQGKVITALRVRACLKQVYDYALECRLVTANPAAQCATKYIGRTKKRTRALSPAEIRVFIRTLDASSEIQLSYKLALKITLLTLTRKSELRLAEWKDVNFETAEWRIPPENTKTDVEHVVFMSTQVSEMFRELQMLACGSPYVLPGKSDNRPSHGNTLNGVLARVSFDLAPFTIHDFRRTASTLLHGNNFAPDVIETALGHRILGVRGTYNVQPYIAERKRLLQWWADFIDTTVDGAKVIVGNFGA